MIGQNVLSLMVILIFNSLYKEPYGLHFTSHKLSQTSILVFFLDSRGSFLFLALFKGLGNKVRFNRNSPFNAQSSPSKIPNWPLYGVLEYLSTGEGVPLPCLSPKLTKGKSVASPIVEFVSGYPMTSPRENNHILRDGSLLKDSSNPSKEKNMTLLGGSPHHNRSPQLVKVKGKGHTSTDEEVKETVDFITCPRLVLRKKIEKYTDQPSEVSWKLLCFTCSLNILKLNDIISPFCLSPPYEGRLPLKSEHTFHGENVERTSKTKKLESNKVVFLLVFSFLLTATWLLF